MDLGILISSHSDTKLRCFICKNYLSHFPIFLCSTNQSICGRCTLPEGVTAFRDEAIENLSESIIFPCRYKSEGCCEELVPKEVPRHEQNCHFRVVPCFVEKPELCEWKGSLPVLSQHCKQEHSELILKEDWVPMELSALKECCGLLEKDDNLLIFRSRFDAESKTISCALYCSKLQVSNTDRPTILFLKNGKATLSFELEATALEAITWSKLSVQSLMNPHDEQQNLVYKLSMTREKMEGCSKELTELNSEVHSILKCSICAQLLLTDVYRNNRGEKLFCFKCANTNTHCYYCRSCESTSGTFYDSNLSKIAQLLPTPCKYQISGCTFNSKRPQTQQHEINCDYANTNCPLNEFGLCESSVVRKDIRDHVLSNHQDLFITLSKDELELTNKNLKCNFFKFSGYLFIVEYFVGSNSRCLWSVQHIGPCEESLKYEIDIVDVAKSHRRLIMSQTCSEWTIKGDVSAKSRFCCYFEKEQIADFVKSRNEDEFIVKFKVRVFK